MGGGGGVGSTLSPNLLVFNLQLVKVDVVQHVPGFLLDSNTHNTHRRGGVISIVRHRSTSRRWWWLGIGGGWPRQMGFPDKPANSHAAWGGWRRAEMGGGQGG